MPRGPQPAASVPTLSKARRRVLAAVAELSTDAPVLLADVAESIGGHPNTSRQQLDLLAADGLVTAEPVARSGRGRRPLGFVITPLGRQALAGFNAVGERTELLKAFATYLVSKPDAMAQARSVGYLWGEEVELPEEHPDQLDSVVELLEILGFDPTYTHTDQGDVVLLRACPLIELARDDHEVVCELHKGLIDGVLHRAGSDAGIELLPFAAEDGCHVVNHDDGTSHRCQSC